MIELAIKFAEEKFVETGIGNHFLDVFQILRDEFEVKGEEVLIAAILHDTLEDTSATYEEIEVKFSRKVADLVQEVSHPKNYTPEQREEYYEHIKHISNNTKMIKMADFTSHLRHFIKKYEEGRQSNNPRPVNNNDKYIAQIREFLNSC